MQVWTVAIPIVVAIYLIGLLGFLRKLAMARKDMKRVPRGLIFLAVVGGVVSMLLLALWLLRR